MPTCLLRAVSDFVAIHAATATTTRVTLVAIAVAYAPFQFGTFPTTEHRVVGMHGKAGADERSFLLSHLATSVPARVPLVTM